MNEPLERQQRDLADLIARHVAGDGIHSTDIAPMALIRSDRPTLPVHVLHQPAVCIVAQGAKQVMLADQVFRYGPSQFLAVTVDLPLVGQVIEATPAVPYLCFRLDIDPGLLSALITEADLTVAGGGDTMGLSLAPVDGGLLDAAIRLVRLLDKPKDIPILAPLVIREILYRLLSSDYGPTLRQIALADSRLHAINRAINWLKQNYAEPFRIEAVAGEAHMSPSTFHHHFKVVTAMSPLQYQKQIRLQEARRLMLGQAMDAATASHWVGYESPSQFSREYSRLFGAPPSRDIARLKTAPAQERISA